MNTSDANFSPLYDPQTKKQVYFGFRNPSVYNGKRLKSAMQKVVLFSADKNTNLLRPLSCLFTSPNGSEKFPVSSLE